MNPGRTLAAHSALHLLPWRPTNVDAKRSDTRPRCPATPRPSEQLHESDFRAEVRKIPEPAARANGSGKTGKRQTQQIAAKYADGAIGSGQQSRRQARLRGLHYAAAGSSFAGPPQSEQLHKNTDTDHWGRRHHTDGGARPSTGSGPGVPSDSLPSTDAQDRRLPRAETSQAFSLEAQTSRSPPMTRIARITGRSSHARTGA
jgi:hypothetical protein